METIQSAALEFAITLAIGGLGLLAAYASYGIKKAAHTLKVQTEKLEKEEQRTLFINALDDAAELTDKVVSAIEQTTASGLRELVKDGKANRKELEALAIKAADEIKRSLAPQAQKIITEHFGSFEKYLKDSIEAKVHELKTKPTLLS